MSLEDMDSMEQDSYANQCESQYAQRRGVYGSKSQLSPQGQVAREHAEAALSKMMMAHRMPAAA